MSHLTVKDVLRKLCSFLYFCEAEGWDPFTVVRVDSSFHGGDSFKASHMA